jgi:hypothetical protein
MHPRGHLSTVAVNKTSILGVELVQSFQTRFVKLHKKKPRSAFVLESSVPDQRFDIVILAPANANNQILLQSVS